MPRGLGRREDGAQSDGAHSHSRSPRAPTGLVAGDWGRVADVLSALTMSKSSGIIVHDTSS